MSPTKLSTCVILAGGLGTRLRSVVGDVPKCLAPVGDRTFLDIQIRQLATAGIEEIVLSLGHLSEQVIAAVSASAYGIPVRNVVEPELLGTGGAIGYALDALGLDEVLVANGDTYLDGNLSAMTVPLDRDSGELLRMAVVHVPDRARFGGVEMAGSGIVTGFVEKGRTSAGFINAGLYRLRRATLPGSRAGAYSLETEVMPDLLRRGALRAHPIDGRFIDIGVPDDYSRFCQSYVGR